MYPGVPTMPPGWVRVAPETRATLKSRICQPASSHPARTSYRLQIAAMPRGATPSASRRRGQVTVALVDIALPEAVPGPPPAIDAR